ncbi:hypothetical protein [Micromonospora yangpuensis]|nr:hypothetical protein [Micromonospora yangpuensis]
MTVWRYALRVGVVLACLSGVQAALAAPAHAAFSTELSGLPAEFTAGGRAETVSAVVSRSDNGGCQKVRWSMLVQVRGLGLDQVRIDRVEETGSFPVQVSTEGGATARLTDRQLDPGTLCRDRTVTAQYRVAFVGDVGEGRVTLAAEAYDVNNRLLARQTATRSVVGERAAPPAPPAPEPTAESTPEPTPEPSLEPTVEAEIPVEEPVESTEPAVAEAGANRPVAQSGGFGMVHAAFLLGGLLLFLGVSLLLRLRHLIRPAAATDAAAEELSPHERWERPVSARRWRPARR